MAVYRTPAGGEIVNFQLKNESCNVNDSHICVIVSVNTDDATVHQFVSVDVCSRPALFGGRCAF